MKREQFENINSSLQEQEKINKELVSYKTQLYELTGIPYEELKENNFECDLSDRRVERKFKGFLKKIQERGENSSIEDERPKQEKEVISFKFKNVAQAIRESQAIKDEISLLQVDLQEAIQDERKKHSGDTLIRNDYIDDLDEDIRKKEKELEQLYQENPESFTALHLRELKEYRQSLDQGRLVETPYVKKIKGEMLEKMEIGKPIFLHGHFGAGKSQLSYSASKDFLIDLNTRQDFEKWREEQIEQRQENNGSKLSEEEEIKKLKEIRKFYETDTSDETRKKLDFYAIPGSKETSIADLYTEKTLGLEKVNGKTYEEHNKEIEEIRQQIIKDDNIGFDKISDEDKKEKMKEAFQKAMEIHKTKNEGFGTVVETIKKELYNAVEEGKPFVFDEVNAVPMEVLLSMNDLLTKEPVSEGAEPTDKNIAFIPGVGKVIIKEGFVPIFTGNKNVENLAQYQGINELNPAFLSRLKQIEYDYVPQRVDGKLENVGDGDNELFQILVAKTIDKNGNMKLPEGDLEKLYRLVQYASSVQKIFSGRWQESKVEEVGGIMPELQKSVLSIRGLEDILEEWGRGRKMDLDMAIWKGFISQADISSDKVVLFKIAQNTFGFFDESDGYNNFVGGFDEAGKLTENFITKDDYKYIPKEQEFISAREAVGIVYGDGPERTKYPDITLENEEKIDAEKIVEFMKKSEDLERETGEYESMLGFTEEKGYCEPT